MIEILQKTQLSPPSPPLPPQNLVIRNENISPSENSSTSNSSFQQHTERRLTSTTTTTTAAATTTITTLTTATLTQFNRPPLTTTVNSLLQRFRYPFILVEDLNGEIRPIYKEFIPDKNGRSTLPTLHLDNPPGIHTNIHIHPYIYVYYIRIFLSKSQLLFLRFVGSNGYECLFNFVLNEPQVFVYLFVLMKKNAPNKNRAND
jgi:hypothetical protein